MYYTIKKLWIEKNINQKQLWEEFLIYQGIKKDNAVKYTIGIYYSDNLIGTGSLFNNIIKCVAVKEEYKGGDIINKILTHLLNEIYALGYGNSFVYTKLESLDSFINLGFTEIARVDSDLIFLERNANGFKSFIDSLRSSSVKNENTAAIVMNANPFTLGHQYLIQQALKECDFLHLFVLSEDVSLFPKNIRLELVKKGTAKFKNIKIHETGDYMVSSKTFPSYFLKNDADITKIHAKLDAVIFKNYIAEALNIKTRFVGEEPLSVATDIYNKTMAEVFRPEINLKIIPRLEADKEVISASRVRALMMENDYEAIKKLVPPPTFEFIISEAGKLLGGH